MLSGIQGKKSYLVAVALFALGGLHAMGFIPDEIYQAIIGMLGGLGLATLRNAVSNVDKKL